MTRSDTEYSEMTEYAAEIFETYGPLAAAYAMLYKHCLAKEMTVPVAEHFVIAVMDAMK